MTEKNKDQFPKCHYVNTIIRIKCFIWYLYFHAALYFNAKYKLTIDLPTIIYSFTVLNKLK
jgi:hypothetical protein